LKSHSQPPVPPLQVLPLWRQLPAMGTLLSRVFGSRRRNWGQKCFVHLAVVCTSSQARPSSSP
jgi:hypothetical protein